ncbi:MAG: flagellar hook-basal body complex protein [FCB group bacterium]|nr:flagellar hook-basal body complex protein [FCB group bacterium]
MSFIQRQEQASGVGAAFTSVLSSLQNQRRRLEVISANIGNLNTIGFKASRMTFLETLGQTVGKLYTPFEQGSFTATSSPTDLAIDGKSFFIIRNGDAMEYSRAGAFFFDQDGRLVTQDQRAVQGWILNEKINQNDATTSNQSTNTALGEMSDIILDSSATVGAIETRNIWFTGNLNASLQPLANVLTAADAFRKNVSGEVVVAESTDELNDLVQTSVALTDGDTIEISGTDQDGNALSGTFTYGAANDGTTIDDLITRIDTVFAGSATASFTNGKIALTDDSAGDSETTLTLSNGSGNTGSITLPTFGATTTGYTPRAVTSIVVYDSFGTEHHLSIEFTKTENAREWAWEVTTEGSETISKGGSGTMTFDTTGQFISNTYDDGNGALELDPGNGSDSLTITLHAGGGDGLSALTQFDEITTISARDQDGQASGKLDGIQVDEQGYIIGSFSNGVVMRMAQLAMAEFPDPTSLDKTGASNFVPTNDSGEPKIGRAVDFDTEIRSGNLEVSNVDMADQFIQMIDAQKGYQAASRIVSTLDRIMEETTRFGR